MHMHVSEAAVVAILCCVDAIASVHVLRMVPRGHGGARLDIDGLHRRESRRVAT